MLDGKGGGNMGYIYLIYITKVIGLSKKKIVGLCNLNQYIFFKILVTF